MSVVLDIDPRSRVLQAGGEGEPKEGKETPSSWGEGKISGRIVERPLLSTRLSVSVELRVVRQGGEVKGRRADIVGGRGEIRSRGGRGRKHTGHQRFSFEAPLFRASSGGGRRRAVAVLAGGLKPELRGVVIGRGDPVGVVRGRKGEGSNGPEGRGGSSGASE